MSSQIKRIGLMGCGVVADYGHVPAIQAVEQLKLCSIFDPHEESLKRMQQKFNIENAFTDEDAFFNSDIDAVSITSPAPCHRANVLNAAKNKLPVICEKPLAMNKTEAKEMIDAMQKADCSLYTAFCYRFSPSALKIKELIEREAIGQVRVLRLINIWNCHGKYEIDANGNKIIQKRREDRMFEGGPMIDCGTHQIDLANFWLNSDVVNFSGHGGWVEEYEAPDHIWLHMDHVNGTHTIVEMSYSYHHTSKHPHTEFIYELIGTKGVIRYHNEAQTFSMETDQGTENFPFHPVKSFTGMYNEWASALITGKSDLLATAQQGLSVTEIASQATEQAINGRYK
ncbi:MAG: Gfo/Idh/MocA family oxidoreductase [Sedimentisphaerales bacterium]|nr:Gfo/Idh/MocA family oxidoreductase [Sedimentisphaerales bacterium]